MIIMTNRYYNNQNMGLHHNNPITWRTVWAPDVTEGMQEYAHFYAKVLGAQFVGAFDLILTPNVAQELQNQYFPHLRLEAI